VLFILAVSTYLTDDQVADIPNIKKVISLGAFFFFCVDPEGRRSPKIEAHAILLVKKLVFQWWKKRWKRRWRMRMMTNCRVQL